MIPYFVFTDVDFVVKQIRSGKPFFDHHGLKVGVASHRLLTYTKGTACVSCGIKGKYFIFEKHNAANSSLHLNLYAVDSIGGLVLMTSDHIRPRSKGGSNDVSNRQPMCELCNTMKGNGSDLVLVGQTPGSVLTKRILLAGQELRKRGRFKSEFVVRNPYY